jgi:glutathione peroxidase-family protein
MLLKLLILFAPLLLATSFYEIKVTGMDGKTFSTEQFRGRNIAIGVVDGKSPDPNFVRFLDSLQAANSDLQVIIIPANDLTKGAYTEAAKSAYKAAKSSFLVLKPSGVLIESKDRSELVQWLTTVDKNGHFQIDLVSANALFVLSKEGELKSVFAGGFPEKALMEALQ